MKKVKNELNEVTLSDLLFPVRIDNETMPCNKEYSKKVIGTINGGDFLLNQCSNIYTLVENEKIFPEIERVLIENDIEYTTTYEMLNYVRFYVNYQITDNRFGYTIEGTNDIVRPVIKVQHSYNGLTKYGISLGYFRLICSNGLVIPVKEMKEFNLSITGKHTENIINSFKQLNSMLINLTENASVVLGAINNKYNDLAKRSVSNPKNRIEELLNEAKITLVDNSQFNTMNYIMNVVEKEANDKNLGYNGQINDWLIYNGINRYIYDNERNIAVPEVRQERDSKVLEAILK